MGTKIEINDTLQLTTEQGFPAKVFDYAKHQKKSIRLADVENRIFKFQDKPMPRIYQLDPVRVYFVHNVDGKWLFWGHVFIQTLQIQKKLDAKERWDGDSWVTSGTYRVVEVYDPEYQRIFTEREAPPNANFFAK